MGVHHGHGAGKFLLALMVVSDHHIHTQRIGEVHFVVAGNAAVHGDHQGSALIVEALNGVLAEAVAVLDPAGDIAQAAGAAAFQIIQQQHRGGNAVHIVVAEHGDDLPIGDGPLDTGNGLVHILHQHGGDSQAPVPLQILGRALGGGDAPGRQHDGQQIGISGAPQEGYIPFLRLSDVPLLEFHGRPLLPIGKNESKITNLV